MLCRCATILDMHDLCGEKRRFLRAAYGLKRDCFQKLERNLKRNGLPYVSCMFLCIYPTRAIIAIL